MSYLHKVNISSFSDVESFRSSDLLRSGACSVTAPSTQDDPVVVDENCTVSVSHMCNGVKSCYNCSDEADQNCRRLECLNGLLLRESYHPLTLTCYCLLAFRAPEYSRCEGSAQCIFTSRVCDGIQDCVNGWDESQALCFKSEILDNFVATGKSCFYIL